MKLIDYIIKKVEMFYNYESWIEGSWEDSSLKNLTSALTKWAKVRNLAFKGFYLDPYEGYHMPEDRWGDRYHLGRSLPKRVSWDYTHETNAGLPPAPAGIYLHICNENPKDGNWGKYIIDFMALKGQVCFADAVDPHFIADRDDAWAIGLLLEGQPTHSFPYDCWSEIDPSNGERYATKKGFSKRSEHWIRPTEAQLIGLVVGYKWYDCNLIEPLAQKLGVAHFTIETFDTDEDRVEEREYWTDQSYITGREDIEDIWERYGHLDAQYVDYK